MWRKAFHAEAMDCIHALQSLVDANKLSNFATRFDEWRKVDLKSTAQVQLHVKELMRLNQSVEQFLHDCGSLNNLTAFKNSFLALNHCVDELSVAKKDIITSIDIIAEQAASKVAATWQLEAKAAAKQQHEQWTADNVRWEQLDSRLDQLQEEMRGLGNAVRKSNVTNLEAFKVHTSDLFIGSGGIKKSLDALDQRMGEWETTTNIKLVQFRETAEQLTQQVEQLEDAARAAKKKYLSNEQDWQEMEAALSGQVADLQAALARAEEAARAAEAGSLRANMLRLKEIDSRGRVQLNRQSGAIQLVTPLEFVAVKPGGDTAAEFVNPSIAKNVASDIAELAHIFEGPMAVEAHLKPAKGGTPAFWDELAARQAELVRSRLESGGVPAERLVARGLAGSKGQNANVVVVKLDSDLFPNLPEPVAASAKKGGKR